MAGIGDMDPRELERAVLLVERISLNIEKITRALGEVSGEVDQVIDNVDDAAEASKKQIKGVRYEVEEMFKWMEERALPRTDILNLPIPKFLGLGKDLDQALEMADRKMKRWGDEMRRHLTSARGPFSLAGSATGLTSIGSGLGALKSQMFAGMPGGVGGLLGMALWGAKREEEFNAASRRAIFTLQSTGGIAQKTAHGLTGEIRSMYQAWGSMGEEIEGTLSAFAEFSIAEEAFKRASVSAKGFQQNITGIATAVDLMNAAQPGTTARLIGETMLNSASSIQDASDQVFRLAAGLREAKLNYGQFAAGIVQATSALRIQNQSLDDTSRLFHSLQKRFEEQGMSKQRAAAMALSGVQAATGAIGGLPQGLQGFIAQRLASKGVEGFAGMKDPFALMIKMQEGLTKGGAFASPVFAELRKVAEKAAGTQGTAQERRLRQIGTLQSLGVQDFEAARAIIDGKDATEQLLTPAQKSAKFTEDLNKAFATRAGQQSGYERDMRILNDEMAQIGGDILTVLTTGFFSLREEVKVVGIRFREAFGLPISEQGRKQIRALDKLENKLADTQGDAINDMGRHFQRIAATVEGSAARATVGRLGSVARALTTYQEESTGIVPTAIKHHEGKFKAARYATGGGDEADHNEAAADALRDAADQLDAGAAVNRKKNRPPKRTAPPTAPRGH